MENPRDLTTEQLIEHLHKTRLNGEEHWTLLRFSTGYKAFWGTPDGLDWGTVGHAFERTLPMHQTLREALLYMLERMPKWPRDADKPDPSLMEKLNLSGMRKRA